MNLLVDMSVLPHNKAFTYTNNDGIDEIISDSNSYKRAQQRDKDKDKDKASPKPQPLPFNGNKDPGRTDDYELLVVSRPSMDLTPPSSQILYPVHLSMTDTQRKGYKGLYSQASSSSSPPSYEKSSGSSESSSDIELNPNQPALVLFTSLWAQNRTNSDIHPHRLEVLAAVVTNIHNGFFHEVHVLLDSATKEYVIVLSWQWIDSLC